MQRQINLADLEEESKVLMTALRDAEKEEGYESELIKRVIGANETPYNLLLKDFLLQSKGVKKPIITEDAFLLLSLQSKIASSNLVYTLLESNREKIKNLYGHYLDYKKKYSPKMKYSEAFKSGILVAEFLNGGKSSMPRWIVGKKRIIKRRRNNPAFNFKRALNQALEGEFHMIGHDLEKIALWNSLMNLSCSNKKETRTSYLNDGKQLRGVVAYQGGKGVVRGVIDVVNPFSTPQIKKMPDILQKTYGSHIILTKVLLEDAIAKLYRGQRTEGELKEQAYKESIWAAEMARWTTYNCCEVNLIKGVAYDALGRRDRAIREYRKGIEHNPCAWECYLKRGDTYAQMVDNNPTFKRESQKDYKHLVEHCKDSKILKEAKKKYDQALWVDLQKQQL